MIRAGTALFEVFEVSAREGERLSEWSARAESVFHACQRHAGIAFPDTVKGCLCLHRCGQSSGAGSHWRQVRNCIACTSSEAALSGVPSPKAQSEVSRSVRVGNADGRGGEIDEDASIDGLEDVEKFINEDDESDFTVNEDEVRKVLSTAWNQKRQEI